jgi:hypothetical protein
MWVFVAANLNFEMRAAISMSSHQENYMKLSIIFRSAIAAMVASAVLALAGCATMDSVWDTTKNIVALNNLKLSGDEEVPPVTTSASGSGRITVREDMSVNGSVKTTGIVGTAAHIHTGAAGRNGGVLIGLTKSGDGNTWSVPDGAKLTDAQYREYKAGNLYVNVHSAAHKNGELRAQMKP